MDDIRAVMDAVGSKRAAIMGVSEGGPMTILFAATYPERTAAAVLYGAGASNMRAEDYPWAFTGDECADIIRREAPRLGTEGWLDERLELFSPSLARDGRPRRVAPVCGGSRDCRRLTGSRSRRRTYDDGSDSHPVPSLTRLTADRLGGRLPARADRADGCAVDHSDADKAR
jgi:pimeloyl-ACP methyl ester carboxylesterase